MLIAQITDMHVKTQGEMLSGALDTYAGLAAALRRIAGLDPQPDLLVATGDLTADGKPEEYDALRDLLSGLDMPCLLLPGNHDIRENLRDAFPDQPWEDGRFLLYAVDDWPVRIVALDSVIPGDHKGELCRGRCRWLDGKLAEAPDKPTIVMLHHPPFASLIGHMDRMGLVDVAPLAEVVARHKQVIRILCGHAHRPIQTMFAGVPASVAPATSFQIQLKLDESPGIQWTREPPAFQLHKWTPDGGLVSHTAYVEEYGHWERPGSYKAMEKASGLGEG
ncbi:MAG: phosphodiesterase [Alphaproteobacteria bacterium]|nr:phosphodiesterase [Alphaproteobacteria bacterium]